jgi:hypothetical protein
MCEVPKHAHFFHTAVSLMPISCDQIFFNVVLQNCCAVMAGLQKIQSGDDSSIARNVAG